jgi:hypothetical protein
VLTVAFGILASISAKRMRIVPGDGAVTIWQRPAGRFVEVGIKGVGGSPPLVHGRVVQLRIRGRPDRHRLENHFLVGRKIRRGTAVDEIRLPGASAAQQRRVWKKPRHRLHIRHLFGAAANDLAGLEHAAHPTGFAAGGESDNSSQC